MKTYRDLQVWQKSMTLVTEIYKISKGFPKDEVYGLTSQTKHYAISIPIIMAEGYGRNSTNEYIHFLRIATGSLYELQTQMEIFMKQQIGKKTLCLCAFAPMNLSSYFILSFTSNLSLPTSQEGSAVKNVNAQKSKAP
jgi:four helix bundle protein